MYFSSLTYSKIKLIYVMVWERALEEPSLKYPKYALILLWDHHQISFLILSKFK